MAHRTLGQRARRKRMGVLHTLAARFRHSQVIRYPIPWKIGGSTRRNIGSAAIARGYRERGERTDPQGYLNPPSTQGGANARLPAWSSAMRRGGFRWMRVPFPLVSTSQGRAARGERGREREREREPGRVLRARTRASEYASEANRRESACTSRYLPLRLAHAGGRGRAYLRNFNSKISQFSKQFRRFTTPRLDTPRRQTQEPRPSSGR